MVFPNVNPSGLCLTLTQVACVLSTLYLCLKLHAAIFYVSKFVENVLNRSYSIALQQVEIKTNIQNTVCGMDDAQVTHFAWVTKESTAEIVHFASQQQIVR